MMLPITAEPEAIVAMFNKSCSETRRWIEIGVYSARRSWHMNTDGDLDSKRSITHYEECGDTLVSLDEAEL